ncbi:DNA mismatch repair endonuclease MutL, partial [bacterium]|nr:DNA mismatch repair endonuclease MutL [bacterium]
MNQIKILSEELINKIAAGEVVERPASVVKELVENSLDAEASQIEIEIKEGGKKLIRVVDNGRGMDASDAKLAFSRHATSKISTSDDLFNISSLGFRGEALPSIASVSKVEMVTKTEDSANGTKLLIDFGEVK